MNVQPTMYRIYRSSYKAVKVTLQISVSSFVLLLLHFM